MDASDGGRRSVVPIASARVQHGGWPCVGDPDTWDAPTLDHPNGTGWFNCGSLGTISLVALVPEHLVMDPAKAPANRDGDPVLVHVTVCRQHTRPVRRWLRGRMHPQDDVMTVGTEHLMRHWGQISDGMAVPTWSAVRAAI